VTPSEWLARNLADVLVAVAQAQANLAGKTSQTVTVPPSTGSDDA
jgi:hypothetical protein